MSFILDALKKSEIERQRQSVPGLIEVPVAARRRGIPVWVWVLAGLLGINVAVLLVLLLRGAAPGAAHAPAIAAAPPAREQRDRDPPSRQLPDASSPDAPPAAADERAPAAADHFSPLDNQPVYAPEIPVQDPGTTSPRGTVPAQQAAAPAHAARRADPQLVDEPADNDEMLPTLSELNLTGTQALPEIHLDVHVYATRTADRFVYINMRKYREGAVLQEGPTLERIRRDGVVLSYNGLRFLVPRQ
jgi:general secretion pathway protein B